MVKVDLRDGKEVIIREAEGKDAEAIISFYNEVGGETDFLSFGKNEYKKDLKDYENYLETCKAEVNSIIFLATINNEIIGIASINSNQKDRTKHVGMLGIVVAKEYCGLSIGRNLMKFLIDWAKSNGVTKKISLVTREDNLRAIKLYKKMGFEEEGLLKEDNYIKGSYYNTLVMSLFI